MNKIDFSAMATIFSFTSRVFMYQFLEAINERIAVESFKRGTHKKPLKAKGIKFVIKYRRTQKWQ
jgi:hypothetical protein